MMSANWWPCGCAHHTLLCHAGGKIGRTPLNCYLDDGHEGPHRMRLTVHHNDTGVYDSGKSVRIETTWEWPESRCTMEFHSAVEYLHRWSNGLVTGMPITVGEDSP